MLVPGNHVFAQGTVGMAGVHTWCPATPGQVPTASVHPKQSHLQVPLLLWPDAFWDEVSSTVPHPPSVWPGPSVATK